MSRMPIWFSRILLAAALSLAGAAGARAFEVTAEQRAACMPDALRLCSSQIPDVGKIVACMQGKMTSLSPQCRAVFQTAGLTHRPHERQTHRMGTTYASYRPAPHPHQVREALWHRHKGHRTGSVYASNRRSYLDAQWTRGRPSRATLAMVRKVMIGYTMACQNHSIPADLCDFSGTSLASPERPTGSESWGNEQGTWGSPGPTNHYAQSGNSRSGDIPGMIVGAFTR